MADSASERPTHHEPARPAWYRDPGLWIAVLATLSARLLFMLNWFTIWRRKGWATHMKYDVSVWQEFWRAIQEGKIPYVDFAREYPVFASVCYWLMSPLVRPNEQQNVYLVHLGVMAAIDLLNVGLFHSLARSVNPRWALPATLLFGLNLTAVVLGGLRFESILVATLLIGYQLHQRNRTLAATAMWSIGTGVKWYPMFLAGAQEVKIRKWGHLWRAAVVFAAVQLLLNGPFLVASWLKNGNIDLWLRTYEVHMHRSLSADTVLGVTQMWLGKISWEGYAAHVSLFLIALAVVVRPNMGLDAKAVLIGAAFLIFNRIYSPQFNLWFYPFLILWMLRQPSKRALWILGTFCLLDLTNVLAYPFAFSDALGEMRHFGPMRAARRGGLWTVIWSASVYLRAGVLLALAVVLFRERRAPAAEREPLRELRDASSAP